MLRRYARLRRYSLKPRKGRIEDRAYLAWIHAQPCMVHDGKCGRWVEAHHVGRPRSDRRIVPLCPALHREGPAAVHRIGQRNFETRFSVSFTAAIAGLNDEYEMGQGRRIA